jgi:nucleotide-binding universal stress UspA family protein
MNMNLDLLYSAELQNYPASVPAMASQVHYSTPEHIQKLFEEVESTFEQESKKIRSTLKNPPEINYYTRQGTTHHVLQEFTEDDKYSFIMVMDDSENQLILNERNIHIIRNVDCPVYIVPFDKIYKPVSTIVYATDYNKEDVNTMRNLASWVKKNNGRIIALHVTKNMDFDEKVKNKGFRDMLIDKVGYENIEVSTLQLGKDKSLSNMVNEFAKLNQADLIAVLKENKGFLERLFSKSSTRDIIGRSDFPVIVFPEEK